MSEFVGPHQTYDECHAMIDLFVDAERIEDVRTRTAAVGAV